MKAWRERVNKTDPHYPARYHIFLSGLGMHGSSITDLKAPTTLQEAEDMLRALIESEDTEWTYGYIEQVQAVVRMGTR